MPSAIRTKAGLRQLHLVENVGERICSILSAFDSSFLYKNGEKKLPTLVACANGQEMRR
ncbi:MAG TPA: hypothetical protein V6D14_22245 [Coleofasciculaceae cyanobacterium]